MSAENSYAILFPGQGAQRVGMCRELAEELPEARGVFERANEALGFDVAKLCFEGPAEELNRASLCQPALLTASVAALEAWRSRGGGLDPVPSAGLSLGEYTALVFAGALTFEDAVVLVHKRGQFMEEAGRENRGGMVAVLGLEPERVGGLVEAARGHGIADAANLNCPGQVVVSGSEAAMEWVLKNARSFGAQRAVALKVSGAFHSRLMAPASDKLREALNEVAVMQPRSPVVSNVTAKFIHDASEIRDLLVRQLTSPVLWEDSMRFLLSRGIRRFVEVGPGRVLSGLLARIDKSVTTVCINSPDGLEEAMALIERE